MTILEKIEEFLSEGTLEFHKEKLKQAKNAAKKNIKKMLILVITIIDMILIETIKIQN